MSAMEAGGIRCMIMRGGTSKGAYFVASDLPVDQAARDHLLLRVMGSPDERQIDGMGGAHPLTSKVAIVSAAKDDAADVEYLFLQVGVGSTTVSDRQNCGNLLAGVAPFAAERGLIDVPEGQPSVRIRMLNTGAIATVTFTVDNGTPVYSGSTAISGVPGIASAVQLEFEGNDRRVLASGNPTDVIEGLATTLIDNGMPTVVVRADALDMSGYESCDELEANKQLRTRIESIRIAAGPLMGLGDVSGTTVPKLTMVAPPINGGTIATRSFIPDRCHQAIGVLGAVSVATACLIEGTPAAEVARIGDDSTTVTIEHPSGVLNVSVDRSASGVARIGVVRTARKLMDGVIFPRSY